MLGSMAGTVQKIVLVAGHGRNLISPFGRYIYMTGGAAAAPTAEREDLIQAILAQHLHDRETRGCNQLVGRARAGENDQLDHES